MRPVKKAALIVKIVVVFRNKGLHLTGAFSFVIIKPLKMKKLKLKALELGASELLTRSQLKNVLGGDGSGGTFCGNVGTAGNCPRGTTAQKCNLVGGNSYEAYCKDDNTGLCAAYGTATCSGV